MDDEEDVKKMIELIKLSKEDTTQDFQYDDFINYENNSDVEETEETICFDKNYEFSNFTSTDISNLNSYDSISVLKPEERLVIDSCSDPELKKLLLLNRTKNFQLMQIYKKLKDLLIQCQKDIKDKREVINNFLKANKDQAYSSGAWRLAAPYFKDKKLYACPPNADTLRKQRNKEFNVYDITLTIKWTSLECDKLLRAVKLNYNINQQNDTLKKIRSLQETKHDIELKELESRMEELQNEDNSEIPPLNSDQYIDWMRVAEVFLQDRRTPFECKSFWHIYLHPCINKSPWTPEENTKLKKIAKKYKYQNWDKIAIELGNNRTGFTTCMHYFSNLHERFKKGDFTSEEDSRLIQLVHRHKMGNYIPWVKIVQHFKNRTRAQLHHRYTYYLTQNDKKKGKFTDAEDILLMILVDKFGKNYKKCAEYLPTRSMVQIKSRYNSNLQQKLKKGSFTKEDDEIIMKYANEYGQKSWTRLTKILQRCRGQIRQRYNTITAYFAKNPNATLDDVPRRKHNQMEVEDPFNFLRTIADQFVDSSNIPTLHEIETVLINHQEKEHILTESHKTENLNIFSNPVSIDEMLTNFFCNSFKINPSKCISSKYVKSAVKDVEAVLDILNAKIDIPQNFDEDINLDNLDVAILNILSDKATDRNEVKKDVCELLPPNFHNLVGLRSLLIKYYTDKVDRQEMENVLSNERKKHFTIDIRCDIVKHLFTLPDETKIKIEQDRKLFYKRFHAIFKWPAVMTLENPSPNLLGLSNSKLISRKIDVRRTYSKADRSKTGDCSEKQIKVSEPAPATAVAPIKLTPVTNKSVLQDLIHNKNKKLFCMETVRCGGGTKTVIKEVDLRSTTNKRLNGISSSRDKLIHSTASILPLPGTKCYEPSSKKRKLFQFVPEHGECIILNTDDDNYESSGDEANTNVMEEEDLKDLNKLESFLEKQQSKVMSKEDDDLEDLRKLEHFLKEQEETDTND